MYDPNGNVLDDVLKRNVLDRDVLNAVILVEDILDEEDVLEFVGSIEVKISATYRDPRLF